ncbi:MULTISPECIES: hypothetical protein [Pseudomonadaceae]|jgi:lysylphosphatidylglycerol synthetase-like protein (DUF2156 family)|uniref:Uncharacterized protein n=2 Tax=Ectopseudomonas TaxID=3236654 RepID=A0AA42LMG6_9GAMM|nr:MULTISPECIES: hypothetical protein [Pseudomonadaceae]HCF6385799.1 hypothetical protein [Pseudomonas aeruginosa]MBA1263194.1 hypothetical protein [Stutzerimonas stutzeri]MBG0843403.1 hypothetical protein [Pseudomonas toyotomiensis]MDH0704178.1 hypothetical protein [Pseudomonas toyotomiensis]MDH2201873.1 hypothetical protein [Pseudomonas oleovorans]
MNELEVMIALIVAGFLLLTIGFAKRDHDLGIYTMVLGILLMFCTIGYKLYLELGM